MMGVGTVRHSFDKDRDSIHLRRRGKAIFRPTPHAWGVCDITWLVKDGFSVTDCVVDEAIGSSVDRLCPTQQLARVVSPRLHVQTRRCMAVMVNRGQVYWRPLLRRRCPCAGYGVIAQLTALPVPSTTTLWIGEIFLALWNVVFATLV